MLARPLRLMRSLLVLILIVTFVAACGGDDDDSTAAATATSPAAAEATSAPTEPPAEPTETATPEPPEATATTPPASPTTAPTATVEPTVEPTAASGQSLPVTVTDADGVEVTVTDTSRIVVLSGDVAEIVWAVGLGDSVVGTDISATYPEGAAALQNIGYQRTLAAEGILSLDPTLIIGGAAAGPPEVIEQLRATGVPVVIIADATGLDGVGSRIRSVAEALGVAPVGDELATTVDGEIADALALAETAESEPTVLFLYVRGTSTQMIGGIGTTADILIDAAGGIDAGSAANIQGYQPLTAESLVTANPDVLLLLTAGLESIGGVDGLMQIPGVAETPAGQNGNVLDFDDLYLLSMGPRTGQVLHDLILGLHPELGQ
ncbi:MAG: ABC transporter substrate-binding protein [Thermomicrobiales bacterium]|nr:ABC transporter substrate-binding protein [Thermomicrobiales bacterium]